MNSNSKFQKRREAYRHFRRSSNDKVPPMEDIKLFVDLVKDSPVEEFQADLAFVPTTQMSVVRTSVNTISFMQEGQDELRLTTKTSPKVKRSDFPEERDEVAKEGSSRQRKLDSLS